MSWLDRKSTKSEAEKKMDAALEKYRNHFGKEYVFQFGIEDGTTEEVTAKILKMIEDDAPQALEGYEPKMLY